MKQAVFIFGISLLAAACSTEGTVATTTTSGGGTTGGGTTGGDTTGGETGGDTAGTSGGATDGATAGPVPEGRCEDSDTCANGDSCIEEICVLTPSQATLLTDNTDDDEVDEAPNLDCIGETIYPTDGPTETTIWGIVDRFGGGRQTVDIEVTVFRQSEWPPKACTDLDLDEQRECFRKVEPEKPEWKVVSTAPEDVAGQIPDQCTRHLDCPWGYECSEVDVEFVCVPQFGLYEIPNVPTNEPLVIRSRNADSQPNLEKKWHDTYVYGSVIWSDGIQDGRYRTNALMVSDGQWTTIPNTLQVKGGIKGLNGAVGGRIRDCHSATRKSYTIGWATVGLESPGSAIGYFNDNEEDTVPLTDRFGTDIFGRFAIVNVPPGWNALTAAADVDGAVVSLGREDFYLIPEALVVVSTPGKKPILNK